MTCISFRTLFIFILAILRCATADIPSFQTSRWTWEERTCTVNVCFAIDGSDTIPPWAFTHELSVVKAIANALSRGRGSPQFAAIQYGLTNHPISPLTADHAGFISALKETEQFQEPGSFLTGGLNYCFSELQHAPAGRKRIVMLGDGRQTIGSDPGSRAELFYSSGGEVYVVGVGNEQDLDALLSIARGDQDKVFRVEDWRGVWRVARQLADALCTPAE